MKNKMYLLPIILILFIFQQNKTFAKIWTIDECVDSALVYNKTMKIEKNNLRISKNKKSEISSNLYPKVDINFDYKYFNDLPYQLMPLNIFNGPDGQFKEAQFGVPHSMSANIQLALPIYNHSIYSAMNTAELGNELMKLNYEKKEEEVIYNIYNLYYNSQILMNQQMFVEKNEENSRVLLEIITALESQGMVTKTDVAKIELQVSQLSTKRNIIVSTLSQLKNNLIFMMGISDTSNFIIDFEIKFDKLDNNSESQNLDELIVEGKSKLLDGELSTLQSAKYPKLSFYANYGYTGFGYDGKPETFLKFFPMSFVGIQGQIPIFNMNTNSKINEKLIEIENVKIQKELVNDKNRIDLINLNIEKKNAMESIDLIKKQKEMANEIYEQTVKQHSYGVAALQDILLSDIAVRESEQEFINSIVKYMKADLELKKHKNILINKN